MDRFKALVGHFIESHFFPLTFPNSVIPRNVYGREPLRLPVFREYTVIQIGGNYDPDFIFSGMQERRNIHLFEHLIRKISLTFVNKHTEGIAYLPQLQNIPAAFRKLRKLHGSPIGSPACKMLQPGIQLSPGTQAFQLYYDRLTVKTAS